MTRVAAATFAVLIAVNAASAQTTAGSADKQDTACTTSPSAASGQGEEKTPNSQTVGKSAVLPDAGGSKSAAPTVQSDGKPLKASPNCPPDSTPK